MESFPPIFGYNELMARPDSEVVVRVRETGRPLPSSPESMARAHVASTLPIRRPTGDSIPRTGRSLTHFGNGP